MRIGRRAGSSSTPLSAAGAEYSIHGEGKRDMGTDLATTAEGTKSVTRWSEPQLTTSLDELLAVTSIWAGDRDLPLISEEDQQCARAALATYQDFPRGSSAALVAKLMGILATGYPAAKQGDKEAAARLELYQMQLADIDSDILRKAFAEAANTCRFFPSVAEIRESATMLPAPARVVRAHRLRRLLAAQREMGPPVDVATPEQIAAIKAEFERGNRQSAADAEASPQIDAAVAVQDSEQAEAA
jgi:hypothetical protein